MKKINYMLLLAISSFCANGQSDFPQGVSGCIAHWDFSSKGSFSGLPDVSGNGNIGETQNIVAVPGFRGEANTAGSFDGNSSLVKVLNAPILNPASITVVALMKFNGFNSGRCQFNNIISKGINQTHDFSFALTVGDMAFDENCDSYRPDKELLNFRTTTSDPYYYPSYSTDYLQIGQWYFFAAVYTNNNVSMYSIPVNFNMPPIYGNIAPTASYSMGSGMSVVNNDNIYIGFHENPPFPYRVNGVYDELALYNRALTVGEIQDVVKYFFEGGNTSVADLNTQNGIRVSAFNKQITIWDAESFYERMNIYDMLGKRIASTSEKSIDLSGFASQIMVVEVVNKRGSKFYKKVQIF